VPKIAFHLRGRILSLLFLGVALFGSMNAWVFRSLMLRNLGDSLGAQGQALVELLSEECAPVLLRRDHLGLDRLMASYRSRYPDTFYIVVYGVHGEVSASTFAEGIPTFLGTPREIGSSAKFKADGIYFRDFTAPILKGALGSVRLGLSESSIRARVAMGEWAILGMVALFLLAGVAGSILIAQDVHRDALRLSAGVKGFRLEGAIPELPIGRCDEIGLVARAVQDMMGRLKQLQMEHMELLTRFRDSDRMSSVGLIASGLAHDINNPLSGLLASLERLARKPNDAEQAAIFLPPMVEAARHIQAVLQRLLQFVRHQKYEEEPVDLMLSVEKACMLAENRLPLGVAIQRQIPDGIPMVRFDPAGLLQVLVNLLINAADAMAGRAGQIRVEVSQSHGQVVLALMDEGPGMAPDLLERVFDPLFTTKPPGEGTGLGLPIARQLMRDHGGEIEIASTSGEGTRVTLLFRKLGG
jgi:signal transduction histidine kinase